MWTCSTKSTPETREQCGVSCGLYARMKVKLLMACSHPAALNLNTPHPKTAFPPILCSVTAHAMFHTLMAAGMSVDLFQKEQKPVLQVSAPTTSSSQQPCLYSVAFVTFGGDSLAFPFVFQPSSQNQIPKMKMYQWCAWSHHPLLP